MNFEIRLNMDNDAFVTDNDVNCHELARILKQAAARLESIGVCSLDDMFFAEQLKDLNGNHVGVMEVCE